MSTSPWILTSIPCHSLLIQQRAGGDDASYVSRAEFKQLQQQLARFMGGASPADAEDAAEQQQQSVERRVADLEARLAEAVAAAETAQAEAAEIRQTLAESVERTDAAIADVTACVQPAVAELLWPLRGEVQDLAGKVALQGEEVERTVQVFSELGAAKVAAADLEAALNQVGATAGVGPGYALQVLSVGPLLLFYMPSVVCPRRPLMLRTWVLVYSTHMHLRAPCRPCRPAGVGWTYDEQLQVLQGRIICPCHLTMLCTRSQPGPTVSLCIYLPHAAPVAPCPRQVSARAYDEQLQVLQGRIDALEVLGSNARDEMRAEVTERMQENIEQVRCLSAAVMFVGSLG